MANWAACHPILSAYVINIAAGVTLLFMVGVVSWIVVWLTGRRPLLSFFGLLSSKRLVLYWSNLAIVSGGAVGTGNLPRSYSGNAVPFSEAIFLPLYQGLLSYPLPGVEGQPGFFRRLFLGDAIVEAKLAPASGQIGVTCSIISFGSPGYNSVSQWIEQTHQPLGYFVNNNSGIEVPGIPVFTDPLTAFVQRVPLASSNDIAFYVGGISSAGTQAAAYLLINQWRRLRKRFGDSTKFCVILKADAMDARHSTILVERQG